jgi:NodT family efflux transporter outer membrane factor (OMF) lipoprotein
MYKLIIFLMIGVATSCKVPQYAVKTKSQTLPSKYPNQSETGNIPKIDWKAYFDDKNLIALIDTALQNNQELNIFSQEIAISKNEILARKGEYLPFVGVRGGAGIDKVGEFTRFGALEKNLDIKEGQSFPTLFSDFFIGFNSSWEIDVWQKLRNAKKAALKRYLANTEARNFLITRLIAEIAHHYYELMALDNLLDIIQQNIEIQKNALQVIKQEKESAKVSQLAVNRFEAQLLNTTNLQYEILQRIAITENRLHFLTGGFPKAIERSSNSFNSININFLPTGLPQQLLLNRPDIRQRELELQAAGLDVLSARASFYPSFRLNGFIGIQAFQPQLLFNPKSIILSLFGDAMAPLINRNSIEANFYNQLHRQAQATYQYQQTVLNAYIEVSNQASAINNYSLSYETKNKEVEILSQSVDISGELFKYARADYMEVLLTQKEALNAKIELTEIKLQQLVAKVNMYKALGGGW